MTNTLEEETIKNHIQAAAKLVAIKLFVGSNISNEITLKGEQVFNVINDILKENYGYTIGKFTYLFYVRYTMQNEADNHGVNLKLL